MDGTGVDVRAWTDVGAEETRTDAGGRDVDKCRQWSARRRQIVRKKIPPKMNFDVWGCVVGLVALKALLPFYGITHAVYQLSTVCILKKEHTGTWDGGCAEMVQNSSAVLYVVRFRMLFEII